MSQFSKRIGFLISTQHLVPHGGIGQFAKGFVEMCRRLDYVVDIILDKPLKKDEPFSEYLTSLENVNVINNDVAISKAKHNTIHAFNETICFETVLNFRDSLMHALQKNLYDAIVINTPEALFSTYALGIQKYINIIFYTHNENLVFREQTFKGVFNENYDEMISKIMQCSDITIGTQTERNADELGLSSAKFLPMPIPERSLLESSIDIEKEGVLFIGRWEDRKGPKDFLKVIKDTKLPAKVMTNATGAKKFKKELDDIGVKYEIKHSIIGDEKVEFIKSSRVFFMPSKSESFGFALMEAMGHCHSVVLEEYDWHKNFNPEFFLATSKKKVSEVVKKLYSTPFKTDKRLDYVRSLDNTCDNIWKEEIESFKPKYSKNSSASINTVDDIYYDDFIKSLNRFPGIEDIISVLRNRHRFNVLYDKDGTYLSTSKNELPERKNEESFSFFD